MLKQREAQAIIAYQVDRLSRDIVDLLASVRDWLRSGIQVHACDIGKVESELDIVLVIKGWQGSDERIKIIERTTRGKNGKAKSGRVVGCGTAPYGYRYADGNFAIIESEAKVVRLIYCWYTQGDGNGKSINQYSIARRLSEMSIPTPGEKEGKLRPREPGIWNTYMINRMLRDETYAGIWRYGKRIGNSGKGGKRVPEEQIAVSVPAIIERETWDAVQVRCEYDARMSKRNAKNQYLLRGMVRCGCRAAMTGVCYRGRCYYRCGRDHRRFAGLLDRKCREQSARADMLEGFVWDYVQKVMKDSEDFEKALRDAQRAEEESLEPKREQLATVLEMIAESESEAAKLANALKNAPPGLISKHLQADITEVERRYAEQIKRRDELQALLDAKKMTDDNIAAALRFREDVIVGMLNPTVEDKRRAFELLNVQVTVRERRAVVTCYIPAEPGVFDLRISRNVSPSNGASTTLQ